MINRIIIKSEFWDRQVTDCLSKKFNTDTKYAYIRNQEIFLHSGQECRILQAKALIKVLNTRASANLVLNAPFLKSLHDKTEQEEILHRSCLTAANAELFPRFVTVHSVKGLWKVLRSQFVSKTGKVEWDWEQNKRTAIRAIADHIKKGGK